jgi:hypothetical protein
VRLLDSSSAGVLEQAATALGHLAYNHSSNQHAIAQAIARECLFATGAGP